MVEILSVTPEEALADVRTLSSKLRDLIVGGYNLTEEEKADPVAAAEFEYQYPNERAQIFIAREGEEILGSLTLILWKDSPDDKRGKDFWPELARLNPHIAERARQSRALACDVGGIVTSSAARGKGIGYQLLSHAVSLLHPGVIVGQTKTVEAVTLRRKLVKEGYRTFYGESEVTPENFHEHTRDHEDLLRAYLYATDVEISQLQPEGVTYVYDGGIAATVPDVSQFPQEIQIAFKPVITAQQRVGEANTIMAPLLSVKSELLK